MKLKIRKSQNKITDTRLIKCLELWEQWIGRNSKQYAKWHSNMCMVSRIKCRDTHDCRAVLIQVGWSMVNHTQTCSSLLVRTSRTMITYHLYWSWEWNTQLVIMKHGRERITKMKHGALCERGWRDWRIRSHIRSYTQRIFGVAYVCIGSSLRGRWHFVLEQRLILTKYGWITSQEREWKTWLDVGLFIKGCKIQFDITNTSKAICACHNLNSEWKMCGWIVFGECLPGLQEIIQQKSAK